MSRMLLRLLVLICSCSATPPAPEEQIPVANAFGEARSVLIADTVSTQTPATRTLLGTNGRFCNTCHGSTIGWGLNPEDDQARFDLIPGVHRHSFDVGPVVSNAQATANDQLDPLFRVNDGTASPDADVSTPDARSSSYALLLSRALIRIGLPVPGGADYQLVTIDDPYGHATAAELSLYRRTLPMTNLRFETTIMWDGRATVPGDLDAGLRRQAIDATLTHAQATQPPPDDVIGRIVSEELDSVFAQRLDALVGDLQATGAQGGPLPLFDRQVGFYPGMNSFPGPDPRGVAFNADVFTLYAGWVSSNDPHQAAIARGEAIFNRRTFQISGVSGLNDALGQNSVSATCGTCHNTPDVGANSQGLLFDLGLADASRRRPDVPLYTFSNLQTHEERALIDPGQGLITGKWEQLGRFKVPGLRGLAAHPPYFHDGSAASIAEVVEYVDARFAIELTTDEKRDLEAFLAAL
jgi:hypothetical protein